MDDVYMYPARGNVKSELLADPLVAHLAGVGATLAQYAMRGAAKAEVRLVEHRETGNAHIVAEKGDVDYYVSLVDPEQSTGQEGGGAKAIAIEGQTNVLTTAFGLPPIKAPTIRRGKGGRYLGRGEGG